MIREKTCREKTHFLQEKKESLNCLVTHHNLRDKFYLLLFINSPRYVHMKSMGLHKKQQDFTGKQNTLEKVAFYSRITNNNVLLC